MLKEDPSALERDELPEVEVKKRRGISLVWLIPLVAGAIAIWLAYTTLQEKGPKITVMFDNAEGLEAGKTRVKYRNVEVGLVDKVALSEDLSHIVVTANLDKTMETHMKEGTRFWIVRPRVGFGGVSGLGTLLSGAYVEFDPGEGQPAHDFVGLAEPPPITSQVPGTEFVLSTDRRGGIGRGAPVYYRGIRVGQVLGYDLAEDSQGLIVKVFVDAPNDQLVRPSSRFWNASGIDVSLGTDGVDVSIESLEALLTGGIAFDTPDIDQPGEVAAADTVFPLFASLHAVTEAGFTQRIPYLVHFDGSVRGLRAGAPVEFRGIRVGTVTDVRLEIDPAQDTVRIPVTLEIEPQRFGVERGAGGGALCRHGRPGRTRAARAAAVRQPADRRAAGRSRFPPRQPAGEAGPQRHLSGDSFGARRAGGAGSFGDRGLEQACGAAAARAGRRSAPDGPGPRRLGLLARYQAGG